MLQRVNRERVVVLGWAPAILMQLAHPLVAAGVAEHSRFLDHPLARFQRLGRTIAVMQGLMFSGPEEMERTARKVNALHGTVKGTLDSDAAGFAAGSSYTALDPNLLLWVFASLLYALPRTYELFVGPLNGEERDRFMADAKQIGVVLRVPPHLLPEDTAALDRFLDEMLVGGIIVPSDTAHRLVGEILHPDWPRVARPLLALAALPAIGLLPPAVRQAYGLNWTRRQERALRITAWICRHVLPFMPRRFRYWPAANGRCAGPGTAVPWQSRDRLRPGVGPGTTATGQGRRPSRSRRPYPTTLRREAFPPAHEAGSRSGIVPNRER